MVLLEFEFLFLFTLNIPSFFLFLRNFWIISSLINRSSKIILFKLSKTSTLLLLRLDSFKSFKLKIRSDFLLSFILWLVLLFKIILFLSLLWEEDFGAKENSFTLDTKYNLFWLFLFPFWDKSSNLILKLFITFVFIFSIFKSLLIKTFLFEESGIILLLFEGEKLFLVFGFNFSKESNIIWFIFSISGFFSFFWLLSEIFFEDSYSSILLMLFLVLLTALLIDFFILIIFLASLSLMSLLEHKRYWILYSSSNSL